MIMFEDTKPIKKFSELKRLYPYYGESCVRQIRFSCAYLFRIKVDGRYFLVRDEQRRNQFQPVGGVYKYTNPKILDLFHAEQCRKFRYSSDLDDDLRVIVPRQKAAAFYKWYSGQTGRENIKNLYREFKEEIIDRISLDNVAAFKEITYRYRGENIVASTYLNQYGERALQLHFADIVELIPTAEQLTALRSLQKIPSSIYYFATESEILLAKDKQTEHSVDALGVSNHSYKILPCFENDLTFIRKKRGIYTASAESDTQIKGVSEIIEEYQAKLKPCDETKPLIFISYNSADKQTVLELCVDQPFCSKNIWIDRKNVTENWKKNIENILNNQNCKLSVIFVNEDYMRRSSACLEEARIIVDKNIPHIMYLLNMNAKDVTDLIKIWISNDYADKTRLKIFKKLFAYDDDTGHIDNSIVEVTSSSSVDHTHFNNFIKIDDRGLNR